MNRVEVGLLLAKAASFDRRKIGDADVLSWHEAVHDVPYKDAKDALIEHYRTSDEYLKPFHVIKGAREIREARVAAAIVVVRADPDDPGAYRAALEAEVERIASGEVKSHLPELEGSSRVLSARPPAGFMEDRAAQEGHSVEFLEKRAKANTIECEAPRCRARIGVTCTADGVPLRFAPAHPERLEGVGLEEPHVHATLADLEALMASEGRAGGVG